MVVGYAVALAQAPHEHRPPVILVLLDHFTDLLLQWLVVALPRRFVEESGLLEPQEPASRADAELLDLFSHEA